MVGSTISAPQACVQCMHPLPDPAPLRLTPPLCASPPLPPPPQSVYREACESASPFSGPAAWYLAAIDLLQQHGVAAAVAEHCRVQLAEADTYKVVVRTPASTTPFTPGCALQCTANCLQPCSRMHPHPQT